MNGTHLRLMRYAGGDPLYFRMKRFKIVSDRFVAEGMFGVTAAKPAKPIAVGYVKVQGYRRIFGERAEPPGIGVRINGFMEVRGCWVTGVAGHRRGITLDQFGQQFGFFRFRSETLSCFNLCRVGASKAISHLVFDLRQQTTENA